MKTKQNRSQKRAAGKPSGESITLALDERQAPLLRACAAYDGITPEEFARDALRSALACVAEAIGHEMKMQS